MGVPVQLCKAYIALVIPKVVKHTIAHDASNSGTTAAAYGIAERHNDGAISYTVLSAIAVDISNTDWHNTSAKFGSIDGMTT